MGLLVAVGLAVVVLLVATGRIGLLLWVVPGVIMLVARLRRRAPVRGPTPGQHSQVTTRFLAMTLDHDSGNLDGTVTEGGFRGRQLSSMSLDELRALLREVAAEPDSTAVLTAYLDRVYGETWREPGTAGADRPAGGQAAMSRDEALRVLGLEPGAGEDQIRAAHRRLMKQFHPDHGGSDYLAAQINLAKEVLLGH